MNKTKTKKSRRLSNVSKETLIADQWEKYYQREFHEWTKIAPFDRMIAAIAHVANHQEVRGALISMADAINRLADVLQAAIDHSKEQQK
jgi:hypothetical protein